MEHADKGAARILIVDDLEANRCILEEIIQDMGCRPVAAASGEEALRLIGEARPRLILSDISMPGMDGYELCRALKNDKKTKNIPIIFISAYDNPKDIIEGFSLGGADYITKPFRLGEVLSRINALLRRSGQFQKRDAILESNGIRIDPLRRLAWKGETELALTLVEYKLLCLFLENPDRVLSRELILDRLWDGNGNYVDDNTLSVYIRRLRRKIEDNPGSPTMLLTEIGVGYHWKRANNFVGE